MCSKHLFSLVIALYPWKVNKQSISLSYLSHFSK
jgi:hypothetical protein